jgi:ATP-binding cassette subfamily C protein CydC
MLIAFATLEVLQPLRRGAIAFGRTHLAARRVAPLLDGRRPERAPHVPHAASTAGPPALAFAGVAFRYGESLAPVLACVDLDIAPGEHVVLTGPSGAGKSTLLALAAGLARPTSGEVAIGGRRIVDIGQPERAHLVGLLTQRTELFGDTIAANLRLAAPEADDAELWQALKTACLANRVRALPDGLAARLGDGGVGLSGGEARWLALARLALLNPPSGCSTSHRRARRGSADAVMANAQGRRGDTVVATHRIMPSLAPCRIVVLGGDVDPTQDPAHHGCARALEPG